MAISTSGVSLRVEPRLIRLGSILVSISMVGLIYAMPLGPLWLIALLSTIMGMGFGMSWSFVSKRIIANVLEEERTQGIRVHTHVHAGVDGVGIRPQRHHCQFLRIFRGQQSGSCAERCVLVFCCFCPIDPGRSLHRLARQPRVKRVFIPKLLNKFC